MYCESGVSGTSALTGVAAIQESAVTKTADPISREGVCLIAAARMWEGRPVETLLRPRERVKICYAAPWRARRLRSWIWPAW